MGVIIGFVVIMVMVFGGYILVGGKMSIIFKLLLFEMMMIGGVVIGVFVVVNDFLIIKYIVGDVGVVFVGLKWKK